MPHKHQEPHKNKYRKRPYEQELEERRQHWENRSTNYYRHKAARGRGSNADTVRPARNPGPPGPAPA